MNDQGTVARLPPEETVFSNTKAPGQALEPIQPIQSLPEALSMGVKRRQRDA